MTATATLRRHLDEGQIQYRDIGQLATRIRHGGVTWVAKDNMNGTLCLHTDIIWPHMVMSVMGHTTVMERCGDYAGCGSCHRTVWPQFRYCPWCGAMFE